MNSGMRIAAIAAIAVLWSPSTNLTAQQQSSSVGATPPKQAIAIRAPGGAVKLDGRLDEPAWLGAFPFSDFVQRDPHEGHPPSEPTEVRVLYTDAALYVGVRAFDSKPDQIAKRLTRRDEDSPSDWILVAVDSYHDRRTAFAFSVNPAGVKKDEYLYNDTNGDDSWNAVWDVAVSVDSLGWTAEFEIPFSQLRFPKLDRHEFGFNVVRVINRLNEEQHWRLISKTESGVVSRFGDLVGIQDIRPPRRLEIQPYTVLQGRRFPAEEGNPFATGREGTFRAGADILYGVTSNLTLNATINPDFGQVEADPAVVNLSAFETFFEEKRPFFNEGLDIFRFNIGLGDGNGGQEELFYTRRVGRAPQGDADPRDGYAEVLGETTILGAAKLSGKTPSGWTVGFLGALTAEEEARVRDASGADFRDVVEPRTTYLVGRLGRDLRNGQTVLGLFGTGAIRDLPDAGNLDFLRSSGFALGTNWDHRFRQDTYHLRGWVAGSQVHGSPEAIGETQRSPARYYQRPDNDYVTYDPTRTSLDGLAGQLAFGKHGGGNWRWEVGVDTRSPGFEVNDLGFMREADRSIQWSWLQRRWVQPGKVFRRVFINVNQWYVWNYGWDKLNVGGNVNANFTLLNYWGGFVGFNREWGGLNTGATRGGPAMRQPNFVNGWFGFFSDHRKPVRVNFNGFVWNQEAEETGGYGANLGLTLQPATYMDFRLSPRISRNRDDWQYLQTEDALGETRYVFGDLKQTTVAMQLRGNVTFRPTLSLQVYLEPFIASGEYLEYKQVADPRAERYADRFAIYQADQLGTTADGDVLVDLDRDGTTDLFIQNPNFRFLSFRSNAVLRWEYRPGSTLFVVWQHGRRDFFNEGRFDVGDGLDQLFRAPATNTFVVKLNYWFSL